MSNSTKASSTLAAATPRASGMRSYSDLITRHTYVYVPGSFTQEEAGKLHRGRREYPVVR